MRTEKEFTMNKKNLELLGLSDGATAEEIKEAYEKLRAKYLEERFKDGEEGNNAAKMLSRLDVAYQELTNELNESATENDGGASFTRVEELLKAGDVQEAQRVLDSFNERTAYWHYLQSVVFYRKNWMNESKKQLEIAMQLEPDNEKYREKYRILQENMKSSAAKENEGGAQDNGYRTRYDSQNMDGYPGQDQMGRGFCENCVDCCSTYLCLSCFCDSCCR